jgi:hypothetical protein
MPVAGCHGRFRKGKIAAVDVRSKQRVQIAAAAGVAVVLGILIARGILARTPYKIDPALLSNWTLAAAPPGNRAVVEAKPPSRLLDELFRQVSRRTNHQLVPAERAAVPLVLADEYSDSLQGALSVQDIISVGEGVGLDTARFEPVCIAERHRENGDELYFAVFDAPLFDQFRYALTPLFPEQAGAGVYYPPAVRLILAVAATSKDFDGWWPIGVNPQDDCSVSLRAD